MKKNVVYVCQNCGAKYSSWMGRCANCQQWNTLVEEVEDSEVSKGGKATSIVKASLQNFSAFSEKTYDRIRTGFKDFDVLLGGGIVQGSLNLLSGEPGVGKSTLILQLIHNILQNSTKEGGRIFYFSGEESPHQLYLRAKRIGDIKSDKFVRDLFLSSETDIEKIVYSIEQEKPMFVVLDSIQTIYSSELNSYPGSVSQVRYCTDKLLRMIKKLNIPTFVIGQVTKEGVIAGPKVLEHMVDVVLQLEGGQLEEFRLLKTLKNRFGNTDEVAFWRMTEKGLQEVRNPSTLFLSEEGTDAPGAIKSVIVEGNRSLIIEVQALVVPNYFPPLRRTATGIDYNRLLLLTAVLERSLNLKLQNKDIYVKVSSGIKIDDPAIDLAVCLAIYSSYCNTPITSKKIAIGEVGLLGEIRNVRQMDKRTKEAIKLGYDQILNIQSGRDLGKVIKSVFPK